MCARLTRSQGPAERIEELIRVVKEDVIPAAQKIDGFKGGYWAVDRSTGTAIALTFFTNESALKASRAAADKIRAEGTQKTGGQIVSVEEFEVFAEA
jgi:hypothetical protein